MAKCFLLNVIPLSIKLNEIVNKFLRLEDKFMTEMHLKQPSFIVLVVHLQKNK